MAHSLSAKKRMRQNVKRAARNRARRSQLKGQIRKVTDALLHKDAATAEKEIGGAIRLLDRSAAQRTLHKNAAARRKSRLMRKINALKAAAAPAR